MITFDYFFELLSSQFMQYAFISGICIALACSLLGVSLVLKKQSMIGDGLSHVGFGACAIALCIGWAPLGFAIPIVIISSFLILWLAEHSKVLGDSAIAVFSTLALAVGYASTEISKNGSSSEINNYLYGNILGLDLTSVIMSIIIVVIVVSVFIILYNKIFTATFDPVFSKSTGTNATIINITISILTSLVVVIGMKLIGALLITALIIFPTLSARLIFKTFKHVTIFAAISSVVAVTIGLFLCCIIDKMPVGSSIVFTNFFLCVIAFIIGKLKPIIKEKKEKKIKKLEKESK